jgi:3-isopropylmalate/(R)-2-methylmalate dehydratase large subunit
MGATFTEKILARNAGRAAVQPGEVLDISPDVVLSHDNTAAISKIFAEVAHKRVK